MVGGYQWLGEFVYGAGGLMDAFTRARVNEIFNKAQKGLSTKPLRVSIKLPKKSPIESYASVIDIASTPGGIQVKLKVDTHYGLELNNLYLIFNQDGTFTFESD